MYVIGILCLGVITVVDKKNTEHLSSYVLWLFTWCFCINYHAE